MIDENKYMKDFVEKKQKLDRADFAIELFLGVPVPEYHPKYNEWRTSLEIYSYDFKTPSQFEVSIEGQEFNDRQDLFVKIKSIVEENLNQLIKISKEQTNEVIINDSIEGGSCKITIKYGQLLIHIDGNVDSASYKVNKFVRKILNLFQ